jgi:hypothetical protein
MLLLPPSDIKRLSLSPRYFLLILLIYYPSWLSLRLQRFKSTAANSFRAKHVICERCVQTTPTQDPVWRHNASAGVAQWNVCITSEERSPGFCKILCLTIMWIMYEWAMRKYWCMHLASRRYMWTSCGGILWPMQVIPAQHSAHGGPVT